MGLFPGDRGRKKIAQLPSDEIEFRPMRRIIRPTSSGDDLSKTTGKRAIRPKAAEECVRAEARHNLCASTRSG